MFGRRKKPYRAAQIRVPINIAPSLRRSSWIGSGISVEICTYVLSKFAGRTIVETWLREKGLRYEKGIVRTSLCGGCWYRARLLSGQTPIRCMSEGLGTWRKSRQVLPYVGKPNDVGELERAEHVRYCHACYAEWAWYVQQRFMTSDQNNHHDQRQRSQVAYGWSSGFGVVCFNV